MSETPHVVKLIVTAEMSDGSTRTATLGGNVTQTRTAEAIASVLAPILRLPE